MSIRDSSTRPGRPQYQNRYYKPSFESKRSLQPDSTMTRHMDDEVNFQPMASHGDTKCLCPIFKWYFAEWVPNDKIVIIYVVPEMGWYMDGRFPSSSHAHRLLHFVNLVLALSVQESRWLAMKCGCGCRARLTWPVPPRQENPSMGVWISFKYFILFSPSSKGFTIELATFSSQPEVRKCRGNYGWRLWRRCRHSSSYLQSSWIPNYDICLLGDIRNDCST